MDFSTRLKKIIIKRGQSIRSFEEEIGCSIGVINRCINKKTDVSSSVVIKIITTCREINPEWLLLGEGDMMKNCIIQKTEERTSNIFERETERLKEIEESLDKLEEDVSNKERKVPLIPLYAMAGKFPGEKEIMDYECERYSVPGMDGADFLIQVKGNSMYPTYNSGDVVACKRITNTQDSFFQWNRVYVLDTDQGPIMKRIKPGSDKEHISIVSDNPDYEPFELHFSQIYHIALVLGCIKLE